MEVKQQEKVVSEAFSRQSDHFDMVYDSNMITVWAREQVREEVLQYLPANAHMLELNCGTGTDSVFFAKKGYKVFATDNAEGMLQMLNKKLATQNLTDKIETQRCSFNNLEELGNRQFDYAFSNFGGLNCTDNLAKVLDDVEKLLKPGGSFSFVIMPVVCPWDLLMVFKGYFKTAFRRFNKKGTMAHLEGVYFKCYYYNPSYIIKHLEGRFKLQSLKSVSLMVPPPYIEQFVEKHPKLFRWLEKVEKRIRKKSPFNSWGDYYIITMQKNAHANNS